MELTGQLGDIFRDAAYETIRDNAQTFFATQLQQYATFGSDDVTSAMCFFCDFLESTKATDATDMVIELGKKFLEVMSSPQFSDDPDVQQTGIYGLGVFGYYVPKGAYGELLQPAVTLMKDTVRKEGAFEDENMVSTENAMGGIARLCYNQMDGTHLTEEDLIGVFSKMPFTHEEAEAQQSHELILKQFAKPDSIIHSANVKAAAQGVVQRIVAHLETNGNDPKIISHVGKAQL